ncbi:MAG TPA: tandem-95 repeat protein, partial [Anaerolineae bacterium]|nr:tandem-95 repeat protein [Anaerolineae bacterium]
AIWLDGTRSASDTFALAAANTQPEGIADPSGNDPPVANDDYVYDVQEWVPVDIYVLANDYDPNQGDTLTIDSVGQPSQGFVVINTAPNGEDYLTYTADPGFTSDSFTYTIMDDWGDMATATVWLESSGSSATANDDEVHGVIGGSSFHIDVLQNDSDPDGDPLSIVDVSVPARGSVWISPDATHVTFSADADFADDSFTYTVADPSGNQATATVRLYAADQTAGYRVADGTLVIPAVSLGLAALYGRTSFYDGTRVLYADLQLRNDGQFPVDTPFLVGVINISHPTVRVHGPDGFIAGGIPYYDFSPHVAGGTLAPGDTTGTGVLAFYNPDRVPFTYDLVVFGGLNDPPHFTTAPVLEVPAGQTYSYDADAVDPDQETLTYRLVSAPASMTIDPDTGQVTWATTTADQGTHAVRLRVEDPRGGFDWQDYQIRVTDAPPNRPPYFTSTPVTEAYVNIVYDYPATAEDPDQDVLSFSLHVGPDDLTIDSATGQVTWVPGPEDVGQTFDVTLRVTDPHGAWATQPYQIYVLPQPGNHPPVIVSQPETQHDVPGSSHPATQNVTPSQITIDLELGETLIQTAQVAPNGGMLGFTPPTGPPDTLTVENEADAWQLLGTLLSGTGPGLRITDVTLTGHVGGFRLEDSQFYDNLMSTGIYVNNSGTYGMDDYGIVLSSGNAADYGTGPDDVENKSVYFSQNKDENHNDLLDPITGGPEPGQFWEHYDVTRLEVNFDMLPGHDTVSFNVVFGSEEWEEWVDSPYNDAFGLYADGQNIAQVGGFPVNIDHPEMKGDGENNPDPQPPDITSLPEGPAVVNQLWEYPLSASDPSGELVEFALDAGPAGMTLDWNPYELTGLLTWQPTQTSNGEPVTIKARATGEYPSDWTYQTFSLPVVDALPDYGTPVITSLPTGPAQHGKIYQYQLIVSNSAGPYQYSLTGAPENMTIDQNGLLSWDRPQMGDAANATITVQDTGTGLEATQPVDLSVAIPWDIIYGTQLDGVLAPDRFPMQTFSKNLGDGTTGHTLTFIISDTSDPVLDTTVYISSLRGSLPGPVDIDLEASLASAPFENLTGIVPGVEPHQTASFDAKFTGDGHAHSFDLQFINAGTGAVLGTLPVSINNRYFYLVQAIDPDGDELSYSMPVAPAGATMADPQDPLVQWLPPEPGTYDFTVRVEDGRGGWDEQAFQVVVTGSGSTNNNPPTITSTPPTQAAVNRPYAYPVQATDPDGDRLRYYLLPHQQATVPQGMAIDTRTGLITWTPASTDPASVIVQVTDRRGGEDFQQIVFAVQQTLPNTAPEFTSTPVTGAMVGQNYTYHAAATDAQGDPLTFDLPLGPVGMSIDPHSGAVVWTPEARQVGTHDVLVRVRDGQGGVDLQWYELTVSEKNLPR